MLQLKNDTAFQASIAVFPDADGVDTLYVIVKGTFGLTPTPTFAEEPVPVVMADEYWGEPGASSLKYASEMHLVKPSTDVVLVGQAWAPGDRPVPNLDVQLTVAERQRHVRVFGDREWSKGVSGVKASSPKPFTSMPLDFERAYGGVHEDQEAGKMLAEETNPVGVGFVGNRKEEEMAGTPLPNLEDPSNPVSSPLAPSTPMGFGFVAPSWMPRRQYAGTYDEAWQKGRAPYLPVDFDARFFNAAPPEMVFDRYLQGGEPIVLVNASQAGMVQTVVPQTRPSTAVRVAGSTETPDLNLETVLLEPDANRMCLTWRGAVPCDKKVLKVEEIIVQPEAA